MGSEQRQRVFFYIFCYSVPTYKPKEGLPLLRDNIFISYKIYGALAMKRRGIKYTGLNKSNVGHLDIPTLFRVLGEAEMGGIHVNVLHLL